MRFKFPLEQRLALIVGCAAFALLAVMVAMSPPRLCYDEIYHINLAKNVQAHGWRAALTAPDNCSAAGPLYPALHLATVWGTGLKAPSIRVLNLLLLGLVIVVLAYTEKTGSPNWWAGLSILAVPFLWPPSGMALTELPALAAFTVFVLAIRRILEFSHTATGFAWAGLAGFCLGLSILGRQVYLIVLPAVAALLLVAPRQWGLWLVCLCVACGACGWLFVLWGGLVPPSLRFVNSAVRLDHGVFSLSYVAAATLFLRPEWLKPRSFKTVFLSTVSGVLLALLSRDYANPPAKSLLLKVFGEKIGLPVGFAAGTVLIVLGVLWSWNALLFSCEQRREAFRVFLFLTLFALTAAPAAISHEFSSRYVVGLLPVLVLTVRVSDTSSTSFAMRAILGAIAGAATLWTYYWQ